MAFVDPNQPGQPAAPATNPLSAPISSGGGAAGPTKAASTPGQNVPAQPSAQLSAYLNANKPQAESFGTNIAGTVGGQTQAAGQAIQPAVNTYTGQLYTVPTDTATNAAVAASPSSLTPDQQASFKAELGASAAAPSPTATFEASQPYQDLSGNIQKTVEQANLWNSGNNVANLSTALAPFEGANATTGDKTLDSLLLSRTPGAYKQIQDAVAPAAALPGQLQTGTQTADQALQSAIAADQAATPAATGAASSYAKSLNDYLTSTLAANQANVTGQNTTNATLTTDLASGNLTASDATAMGIPPEQAQAWADSYNALNPAITSLNSLQANPTRSIGQTGLSPVDLTGYLTTPPAPTLTLANTATPQNYADIAALQSLMGANAPAVPIDASTADQAGLGLNASGAATFNDAGAIQTLNPVLTQAIKEQQALKYYESIDPAQNPGQASVLTQADNGIQAIINYLNQLGGKSGVGITPKPGGYRLNV